MSAVSESTAGAGPLPTFSLAPRPQQVWAWPLMISNFDIDAYIDINNIYRRQLELLFVEGANFVLRTLKTGV